MKGLPIMKIKKLFFTLFIFLIACSQENKTAEKKLENSKLSNLEIFGEEYPKAFFFRSSEKVYDPYENWDENFNRLSGIIGKVLHEELKGREKAVEYFKKFKQKHPEQVVLLHFNGDARDPLWESDAFFDGHWLYFEGSKILSDIMPEETSTFKVENARLFKMKVGTREKNPCSDEIGICSLDENGHANWHDAEQVKLLAVDYKANTITVKRGCFGTKPKTFKGGKVYAAAHVVEGPWGMKADNPLMWCYNYSTKAPKDKEGRLCYEIIAQNIGGKFLEGGELEIFDGIEFDVLHHNLENHSFLWMEKDRHPDCNGDTKPDFGILNGINTYGIGTFLFCKELREIMGDQKLIMADGFSENHIRAFPFLNGIESEGWPTGGDRLINDWSGGINRHLFWNQNALKPAFSFVNHKWFSGKDPSININRLVLAGSMFSNSIYCVSFSKPFVYNTSDTLGVKSEIIYDEIVKGKENQTNWLGKPVSSMIRLAEHSPDLLKGNLKIEGENLDVTYKDEGHYIIKNNSENAS